MFKEFKNVAERECGHQLVCLRTDRGGEFNSKAFERYCTEKGIKRQLTASYTPQQNGIAERKNMSIMNMVRCMLFGIGVPLRFWPEETQYAVPILNRSPTAILGDVKPTEKWSAHKPSVEHLRVFGCVAFALIPYEKRVKLDEKSVRCIMFGVSKESKAYRLYDPDNKRIIISKDVRFDEGKRWEWEEGHEEEDFIVCGEEIEVNRGDDGEVEEEATEEQNEGNDREDIAATQEETHEIAEPVAETETAEENTCSRRAGRNKTKPVWMRDYICEEKCLFVEEDEGYMVLYINEEDPEKFEETVKHDKWKKAMEAEIKAIKENETWELVDAPSNAKIIGVKWVFKTKLNERGEVDKFKARIVAKGFHQTYGIDFHEVFAPVARWDTIRVVLGLAAQRGWSVFQLDVKSAFLHGELKEDVYIEKPKGFESEDESKKVYKLKKALYGLRQAPRGWYSRIEGYFAREGFKRCYCEHTLFVKTEGSRALIVSLYVDDLIYTSDSEALLEEFKRSMKEEFAMTDLGK